MDIMENAVRDLMDALVSEQPALQKADVNRSIDDNVASTGVSERSVKAYMLGRRALDSR